jgi:hypothetical protein
VPAGCLSFRLFKVVVRVQMLDSQGGVERTRSLKVERGGDIYAPPRVAAHVPRVNSPRQACTQDRSFKLEWI